MKRKIAQICFAVLVFLCCGFSFNLFAGDHESYYPRTPAGGAGVAASFLFDVAGVTKYDAWVRYRYTDSTDIQSETTTESTSYNSSGIPSGTSVVTERMEYTSHNNPYDE